MFACSLVGYEQRGACCGMLTNCDIFLHARHTELCFRDKLAVADFLIEIHHTTLTPSRQKICISTATAAATDSNAQSLHGGAVP